MLSCNILKELPRHGETDLVAEVWVNACTTQSVYKFIEEFQYSSFANLNLLESGDKDINGPRTKVNISRKCHHNVHEKDMLSLIIKSYKVAIMIWYSLTGIEIENKLFIKKFFLKFALSHFCIGSDQLL